MHIYKTGTYSTHAGVLPKGVQFSFGRLGPPPENPWEHLGEVLKCF